jgi:hypothetical protein
VTIILRPPWTRQPQGAAQFLDSLAVLDAWSGHVPGVTQKRLEVTQLAVGALAVGPAGLCVDLPASQGRLRLAASVASIFPTGLADCTIAMVIRHKDTTLRGGTAFSDNAANTSNRLLVHAPFSDGNAYFDFGNFTLGSGRISGSWGGKTTNVETLVCVAGQGKGREIWRNGRRLANNTSAKAVLGNLSAVAFWLGSPQGGDSQEIYLFIAESREWSDAEIHGFAAQPWAKIFAPRRIFVPVSAAPSGAPTLSDLKATNITATSVQFTYDYSF